MPVLPSGRRIEFSLDRFYVHLGQMPLPQALSTANALRTPDDLLWVLDAVHFSLEDGSPFFANYVAADWESYAAEWTHEDREALRTWFFSESARYWRAEAIETIQHVVFDAVAQNKPHSNSLLAA
jgi:hypothetical protein